MTSQTDPVINYIDTGVFTAPKRHYTAREFIREYWAEFDGEITTPHPSSLAKNLKQGWERWCVGNHWWAGYDSGEGLWHLSFVKIPRGRPVWVLDTSNEFDSSWSARCS